MSSKNKGFDLVKRAGLFCCNDRLNEIISLAVFTADYSFNRWARPSAVIKYSLPGMAL